MAPPRKGSWWSEGDMAYWHLAYQEEEKQRQRNVVKKFILDHPEYDRSDEEKNNALVKFIGDSDKPFTTETIEWAYNSLKWTWQPKVSTALNNASEGVSSNPLNPYDKFLGKVIQDIYSAVDISFAPLAVNNRLNTPISAKQVDETKDPVYNTDIAPTKTLRRIKPDDD